MWLELDDFRLFRLVKTIERARNNISVFGAIGEHDPEGLHRIAGAYDDGVAICFVGDLHSETVGVFDAAQPRAQRRTIGGADTSAHRTVFRARE